MAKVTHYKKTNEAYPVHERVELRWICLTRIYAAVQAQTAHEQAGKKRASFGWSMLHTKTINRGAVDNRRMNSQK